MSQRSLTIGGGGDDGFVDNENPPASTLHNSSSSIGGVVSTLHKSSSSLGGVVKRSARAIRRQSSAMMGMKMSMPSQAFDRGDKGYLDDLEQVVRGYDNDNDGKFTTDDVFRIVEDLEEQRRRKKGYKRGLFGVTIAAVVLLGCTFGLMIASVTLARKVNTDGDVLVGEGSNAPLRTKSYVKEIEGEFAPENDGGDNGDDNSGSGNGRRAAVLDKYAGLKYLGRTNLDGFEDAMADPDNVYIRSKTSSLVIKVLPSIRDVQEEDELGGKRWVGLQNRDDATKHYLFSCGTTDFPTKCLIYELLPPTTVVGGTTTDSTTIGFRTAYPTTVLIQYKTTKCDAINVFCPAGGDHYTESSIVNTYEADDYTGNIPLTSLDAGSHGSGQIYYYRLVVDGVPYNTLYEQTFKTFPSRSNPDPNVMLEQHTVNIAIYSDASVAKTGQMAPAYQNVPTGALLALQLGDFDHSDNFALAMPADVNERKVEYLKRLRKMAREQRSLVYEQGRALVEHVTSKMTFAHVWDDHDYCGNDSDGTCELKTASRQAYEEYYPGYNLPGGDAGIWHQISLGDVDIFMLDMRSQRTPNDQPDDLNKSVLGAEQKAWLKSALISSTATWKVLASSISANTSTRPKNNDHWISFQTEANELKTFLATTLQDDGVPLSKRTVMITGDLHTGGGIDAGCNNRLGIPELGVPHTNLYSGGNEDFLGVWSEGVTSGNEMTDVGSHVGGYGHIIASRGTLTLEVRNANGIILEDNAGNQRRLQLTRTTPHEPGCPVPGDCAYNIVDTDQASCYDNATTIACPTKKGQDYYNQDAQIVGDGPQYTDLGNGIIEDEITGLMWQADPGERKGYNEAFEGASSSNLGGYDDWRIPSVKELFSLIQFSGREPKPLGNDTSGAIPFIDTNFFGFEYGDGSEYRLIDSQEITNTIYRASVMGGSNDCFFGVNFADGRIKCYPTTPAGGSKYFVRYVRGPCYGENNLINNLDKTITDNATGLMWDENDSGVGMDWKEALDWVKARNNRAHRGYSDWRLPNIKELQSIVDYTRSPDTSNSPAISAEFSTTEIINEAGNVDYPYFWSSTTHDVQTPTKVIPAGSATYIAFGRAMGKIGGNWIDVHGAGAQRSDPKEGEPSDYPDGFGPQGDALRIYNFVRLVRDA